MAKTGVYVGPDTGTILVKVVMAKYIDSQMNITGVGNAKSEGVNRNIIVDIDKTVRVTQRAVRQVEERAGIQIKGISANLPANMLEVENCQRMIAVNGDSEEITDEDIRNVASVVLVRSIPPERQIVSILPQDSTIDGFEGAKDPRGMTGVRLEMYDLLFIGPKTIIHNIRKCMENVGLAVNEMVIAPLALIESIPSDGEEDFGTIVIGVGGGQTTTAVMYSKQLKSASLDQEGGESVAKDISIVLNTSFNDAEASKTNYGDAYSEQTSPNEEFPVDVIGQSEPVKVDERYLSEIISARMEQVFNKAKDILDQIGASKLSGGIVLTGGATNPPGVVDLAQEVFGVNVKLYIPSHTGLRNPVFANVISIVGYSVSLSEVYQLAKIAVTGETSAARQMVVEQETTNTYESYEAPEETVYDKPEPKESEENVKNKIKGFLTNIFD